MTGTFRVGMTLLATIAVGAMASPAMAASTGGARVISPTQIEFTAGAGNANDLVITRSGRTVTIDDTVAITAGKGCKAVKDDLTKVRCTTPRSPRSVRADLGDLDDVLTNRTAVPVLAYGGDGADRLTGGTGADVLDGGDGRDELDAGAGNDVLRSGEGGGKLTDGPGNDKSYGGAGAEEFVQSAYDPRVPDADLLDPGSPGAVDHIDYSVRTVGVTIDADGVTGDDGQPGEHDTILPGMRFFAGGSGADHIVASPNTDYVLAGAGDDTVDAGEGADFVDGGPGDDTVAGGDGNDALNGGAGADRLDGGAGDDRLSGDNEGFGGPVVPTADVLLGGEGADEVSYIAHNGVTVDLDGSAGDDGSAGEGDTVGADVEDVFGTSSGPDVITGNDSANKIRATGVVRGLGGDDTLTVARGSVYGGAGNDTIEVVSYATAVDGEDGVDSCRFPAAIAAVVVNCEELQPY